MQKACQRGEWKSALNAIQIFPDILIIQTVADLFLFSLYVFQYISGF